MKSKVGKQKYDTLNNSKRIYYIRKANLGKSLNGYYDEESSSIYIHNNNKELISTFIHEAQHAIDHSSLSTPFDFTNPDSEESRKFLEFTERNAIQSENEYNNEILFSKLNLLQKTDYKLQRLFNLNNNNNVDNEDIQLSVNYFIKYLNMKQDMCIDIVGFSDSETLSEP